MLDNTAAPGADAVLLKIVVPAFAVCKTVRLPPKTKIKELHETLSKKLASLNSNEPTDYRDYGFCWHSDSGPLWLAESATLRAYNLKNNASIEFKKRSSILSVSGNTIVTAPVPVVNPAPSPAEAKKKSTKKDRPDSIVRKMSAWVISSSSRPASEKTEKKEGRSNSVSLFPRRESDTALLKNKPRPSMTQSYSASSSSGSSASTSTSSSTRNSFEGGNLEIPRSAISSDDDSAPPASAFVNASDATVDDDTVAAGDANVVVPHVATLSDLDALIDDFDDMFDENGDRFDPDKLLEEYAASLSDADLYEERGDIDEFENDPVANVDTDIPLTPSPPLPETVSPTQATIPVSSSAPVSYHKSYISSYSSPPVGYSPVDSPSSPMAHPLSPTTVDKLRYSHLAKEDDDDSQKVPGLSAQPKDELTGSKTVRVEFAKSILEDALEKINARTADLNIVRQYIASALTLLKSPNE